MTNDAEILLRVENLSCAFRSDGSWQSVLDDVSFSLRRGETLCLVGESGCGKTLTALSILGLLPPRARILDGEIRFRGRDLRRAKEAQRRQLRGGQIAMIFQEPMTSLNPVLKIGTQIVETLRRHRGSGRAAARRQAADLLREAGVPDSEQRLDSYPHELSGGLRQRVMMAMALAGEPALLIADEPSTALDVSIQAQILDLLAELRARRGLAILLITHDLGIVAELGHRVLVMYAGQVVESARVDDLLLRPAHPYTRGLLASLPRLDRSQESLQGIPGSVPLPGQTPAGCRFRERCELAGDDCVREQTLRSLPSGRLLRCCRVEEA